MTKKRFLALLLAGILALGLIAGCSGGAGESESSGEGSSTAEPSESGSGESEANADGKTYTIGLCQLTQHAALDEATKGFEDALTDKLGDNVKFDFQNASGDSTTCATIVNKFVSSDVDLIFANATAALEAAAAATDEIPIVGTSITDYPTALDIDDWTGATGRNITGTSDLAPLSEQAAMFKELLPNAKKIGLLYCSSEANSLYQVNIVSEELTKLGYTCTMYSFADSNEIAAVTTTACNESDALYIPTDNTAADNTEVIANITNPAKIPVIAGEEGICKGCGIATLSISYYSIGRAAGEMAYEILVNGADPAEMDIQYAESLTKMYVKDRMDQLGIAVPEGYEELPLSE